jgi:anaerobic magnesium-protoporphyrin IX monomethyl ester cyclase
MRFLLIAPPKRGIAGHEESLPIGLGYLAATLRRLGHEPDLKDCVIKKWSVDDLIAYIDRTKPDIIGITVYSQALRNTKEILDKVKERLPRIITIVGGPHPSGAQEHVLTYLTNADFAINGEGEVPLKHLMPILEKGEGRLQDVPGLIWRQDGKVRWNEKVEYENLDELGFPAWDLLDPPAYFDSPDYRGRTTSVHTSRGCPYGCGFCVKLGRKLRYHSIEKVYEQFKLLNKDYGVNRFIIGDEGFAMNPVYLKDFCRYVIRKKDNFTYFCGCGLRLNSIDDEMCELLKEAKFEPYIGIGIEAGSPRVRDLMEKNLPQEKIIKGVRTLKRHGLKPAGNFILGYPGETKKEMEETINLALRLKLDFACFAVFIPLPGSPATNKLIETGEIPKDFDFSQIDLDCVLYAPKGMTKEELDDMRKKAVFRFNTQPHKIWHHLTGGRLKWTLIKVMRIFLPQLLVPKAWRR